MRSRSPACPLPACSMEACPRLRRGAAALELALILPFVAFLFAVAVDYSRLFCKAQALDQATYNAAWYASGYAYAPSSSASGTSSSTSPTSLLVNSQVSDTQTFNVQVSACLSLNPLVGSSSNVTVTANTDFTTVTSVLSENRVLTLQRTWTVPLKPPLTKAPLLPIPTCLWSPRLDRDDN